MRVVVSGAGGPIGTALTDLLESQGDHVVRLTRGDPGPTPSPGTPTVGGSTQPVWKAPTQWCTSPPSRSPRP